MNRASFRVAIVAAMLGAACHRPPRAQTREPVSLDSVFRAEALDSLPVLRRWPTRAEVVGTDTAGLHGTVTLRFVVDKGGAVEPPSIQVTGTADAHLRALARRLAQRLRFTPGVLLHGYPVRVAVEDVVRISPDSLVFQLGRDSVAVGW